MNTTNIHLRPAKPEDKELIAQVICLAIGHELSHPFYQVALALAGEEHSQYSYRNTIIAEYQGKAAGAVVGYDGALLHTLREPVYPLLKKHLGEDISIEDETEAGEYYLDSVAVLPEYQGLGIGRQLVMAFKEKAFAEGHHCVGLIVDMENPGAESLYQSLGFVRVGEKSFLGHPMYHLQAAEIP